MDSFVSGSGPLSSDPPTADRRPPTRTARFASVRRSTYAMPRLAVLLCGCSAVLVASWAMMATNQANQQPVPDQAIPHAAVSEAPEVVPLRSEGESPPIREAKAEVSKLQERMQKHPAGFDRFGMPDHRGELERGAAPSRKKRAGMRGVNVDRKNIVETVELEDLRAPPGRLWIPAALSGVISRNGNDDPLFNVLVAYCQLDMVAYHESPWLYAMGTFHQRTSGCLDDPSLTRTYRLSSLKVSRCTEETPALFGLIVSGPASTSRHVGKYAAPPESHLAPTGLRWRKVLHTPYVDVVEP